MSLQKIGRHWLTGKYHPDVTGKYHGNVHRNRFIGNHHFSTDTSTNNPTIAPTLHRQQIHRQYHQPNHQHYRQQIHQHDRPLHRQQIHRHQQIHQHDRNSPTVSPCLQLNHQHQANRSTKSPTLSPTNTPTLSPTLSPTNTPTVSPTKSPTLSPTNTPTISPTSEPITIQFLLTVLADFAYAQESLNDANSNLDEWAYEVISNMISSSLSDVIITINNVDEGSITIDYSLQSNSVQSLATAQATISSTSQVQAPGGAATIVSNTVVAQQLTGTDILFNGITFNSWGQKSCNPTSWTHSVQVDPFTKWHQYEFVVDEEDTFIIDTCGSTVGIMVYVLAGDMVTNNLIYCTPFFCPTPWEFIKVNGENLDLKGTAYPCGVSKTPKISVTLPVGTLTIIVQTYGTGNLVLDVQCPIPLDLIFSGDPIRNAGEIEVWTPDTANVDSTSKFHQYQFYATDAIEYIIDTCDSYVSTTLYILNEDRTASNRIYCVGNGQCPTPWTHIGGTVLQSMGGGNSLGLVGNVEACGLLWTNVRVHVDLPVGIYTLVIETLGTGVYELEVTGGTLGKLFSGQSVQHLGHMVCGAPETVNVGTAPEYLLYNLYAQNNGTYTIDTCASTVGSILYILNDDQSGSNWINCIGGVCGNWGDLASVGAPPLPSLNLVEVPTACGTNSLTLDITLAAGTYWKLVFQTLFNTVVNGHSTMKVQCPI
eukprot:85862_1